MLIADLFLRKRAAGGADTETEGDGTGDEPGTGPAAGMGGGHGVSFRGEGLHLG